jgi:DNA (cytosine-5)-methyltransferase 1
MKFIDLFAGCGGFTEGFQKAGFTPVFAVEWDKPAAATYATNFGHHISTSDITALEKNKLPEADVVIGGPPCQGFSNLGTKNPKDPRNLLWMEYLRIVALVKPSFFILENVPRFLSSDQFSLFEEAVEKGPLRNYKLVSGVLNAADFGVPQRRRRAIVIGARTSAPTLPTPTHGCSTSTPWVGIESFLNGIPFETPTKRLPDRFDEIGIPGPFAALELHMGRSPRDLSLQRYNCIPPGGNRFDLPDELKPPCWLNKPTGTSDVMGRLQWDKPALTIRTEFWKPEKGCYLHPQWSDDDIESRVNRPITHWEAARIQSFPDTFRWCGSKAQIGRQIGNAVPPLLAQKIATHCLEIGLLG